ncbi:MAG: YceI family protein [Candidatus Eiseniibacteriota bacterium]
MSRLRSVVPALLVIAAVGREATAAPLPYFVDATQSEILIRTDRSGWLSFAGHRHVIRANRFDGTIVWDRETETLSSLEVRVEAASLEVVDDDLDSTAVAKVQRDMEERVLETGRHAWIAFASTAVEADGDAWKVRGRLDLHGVSREVEVPVSVTRWKNLLRVGAALTVRQTDHGIEPIRVGLGSVRVADPVRVEILLEARLAPTE